MRIYLDGCCYTRRTDDLAQPRIKAESEAVARILNEGHIIIGSDVLKYELGNITKVLVRAMGLSLYNKAVEFVKWDESIEHRAKQLRNRVASLRKMDSLHLAAAETGHADVFLTTDDRLIAAASRLTLNVRVMNPVDLEVYWYDK